MSEPMIRCDHLARTFGRAGDRLDAVHDLTFSVEAGEFVGYAGPNGAGKSTTVKMLTGVLVPTSGTARVDGLVPWEQRRDLNERTGVVFGQRTQLWWDLPLRDSFDLVRRLYRLSGADSDRWQGSLVDALGLGPLLERPVRALSLGERMRSELAAAVLPRPTVLFLDEPTIGLDIEAKATVREFLTELNVEYGTTILLTTHDVDDLVALCKRLLVIDRGELVVDGEVATLAATIGHERVLVAELVDDVALEPIPGLTPIKIQGRRRSFTFSTNEIGAPDAVAGLLAATKVADLALEPPDLEDVIRRIYRGER